MTRKHILIPPRAILPAAAALAALLLPSCRRALWLETQDTAQVMLLVDWSEAGETPEGCKASIYRDGKRVEAVVTDAVEEIPLELEGGTYRIMVMSYSESEYSSLHFEDMETLDKARAVCADGTEFGLGPDTDMEPEWIAATVTDEINVSMSESGVRYVRVKMPFSERTHEEESVEGRQTVLEMKEKPLLSVINTTVHLSEASRVQSLVMHVSGLRTGWDFSEQKPDEHVGALDVQNWVRMKTKGDQGVLRSTASTFGLLPGDPDPKVSLEFTLDTGETTWKWDVPTQVTITRRDDNGGYRLRIDIEIGTDQDPVILPDKEEESGSGTGTDAKVDGWDEQDVTIIDF